MTVNTRLQCVYCLTQHNCMCCVRQYIHCSLLYYEHNGVDELYDLSTLFMFAPCINDN